MYNLYNLDLNKLLSFFLGLVAAIIIFNQFDPPCVILKGNKIKINKDECCFNCKSL